MSGSREYLRYVVKLLIIELLLAATFGSLLLWLLNQHLQHLNYELLLNSLVSLNAGIIIAMFVALFHSENKNIENFRKFQRAAKQVYLIFLLNSAITCFSAIFITNITTETIQNQLSFNVYATLVALMATAKNVHLVYNLLQINFRTTK